MKVYNANFDDFFGNIGNDIRTLYGASQKLNYLPKVVEEAVNNNAVPVVTSAVVKPPEGIRFRSIQKSEINWGTVVAILLLLIIIGFMGYRMYRNHQERKRLDTEITELRKSIKPEDFI